MQDRTVISPSLLVPPIAHALRTAPSRQLLHRVAAHTLLQAARGQPTLQVLLQGFQASGGLLAADLVAGLMQNTAQPISQLARWIVGRDIVTVCGASQTLVPVFQFEPGFDRLRPGLADVMRELVDVFDEAELASWFASRNSSLADARPADVLRSDPAAVHAAARVDRFVATGG